MYKNYNAKIDTPHRHPIARLTCTKNFYIVLCLMLAVSCKKGDDPIHGTDFTIKPVDNSAYHSDGEVKQLYYNGENAVNIVIVGDGFIQDDLKKDGVYDKKVKELVDYFFTIPPYNVNKQYFNTHIVYTQSVQRGAYHGDIPANAKTALKSYFPAVFPERLLSVGDPAAMYRYVEKAVPRAKANIVVVIVNDEQYGGSGGQYATMSVNAEAEKYLFVHETGHSFANLADEYVEAASEALHGLGSLPGLPNADNTNDLTKIKWARYIGKAGYEGVGAFAGSYYRANLYRPEFVSIMGDSRVPTFNAPSREAIVRSIYSIVGIPFDFDAFIAADRISGANSTIRTSAQIMSSLGNVPSLPPINDHIK